MRCLRMVRRLPLRVWTLGEVMDAGRGWIVLGEGAGRLALLRGPSEYGEHPSGSVQGTELFVAEHPDYRLGEWADSVMPWPIGRDLAWVLGDVSGFGGIEWDERLHRLTYRSLLDLVAGGPPA